MKFAKKSYRRGKTDTQKPICPECQKEYMYTSYCRKLIAGKQKFISTGLQCVCGHHINNEEGLELLKD